MILIILVLVIFILVLIFCIWYYGLRPQTTEEPIKKDKKEKLMSNQVRPVIKLGKGIELIELRL